MSMGKWVTFFSCLLVCITFYYTICSALMALTAHKWDRVIGLLFTALGFYSSYVVIDFIILLVK